MWKKTLSAAFAGLLTCSLLATPALAHGHHGGRHHQSSQAAPTVYALCEVEGCTASGRHLHEGVYYCGAHHEEGYCLGNCPIDSPATPSRYCGHHGGRHCR